MEVNTKLSKGTKKALNKAKVDRIEDKVIKKVDMYLARKEARRQRRKQRYAG